MKAKTLLIFFLLASAAGYSHHIPKPSILFGITQRILAQAQELLFASDDKPYQINKLQHIIKVESKLFFTSPVHTMTPIDKSEATVKAVKLKRDGMFIRCEK